MIGLYAGQTPGQLIYQSPQAYYDDTSVPARQVAAGKPDTPTVGPFDPMAGGVLRYAANGADSVLLTGDCDAANGALGLVVVTYRMGGPVLSVAPGLTLTAGNFYATGGHYCVVGAPLFVGLFGADQFAVIVTSVRGNWNLAGRLCSWR